MSVENAKYMGRIDQLRATRARVKFLSLEPLLGPLPDLDLSRVDWVIVGGESGPGARPMNPQWAIDIRDQCRAASVPFFSSSGVDSIRKKLEEIWKAGHGMKCLSRQIETGLSWCCGS